MKIAEVVTCSHESDIGEVKYKLEDEDYRSIRFAKALLDQTTSIESVSFCFFGEVEIEKEETTDLRTESYSLLVDEYNIWIVFYEKYTGEKFCVQVEEDASNNT